jgi:hypothetical protein
VTSNGIKKDVDNNTGDPSSKSGKNVTQKGYLNLNASTNFNYVLEIKEI